VRRQSIDPEDLFIAHIGGMDAFARGLKIAARMLKDKRIERFVQKRYSGWDKGLGLKIEQSKIRFEQLEAYTLEHGEPKIQSGKQEMLENLLNEYIR
jgi:xylose isomerase